MSPARPRRRIPRLPSLAVAATAAAALAVPSPAAAQGTDYPTAPGVLAYSTGTQVNVVWPDGSHRAAFGEPSGVVGSWDGSGRKLSLVSGESTSLYDFGTKSSALSASYPFGQTTASASHPAGTGVAANAGGKVMVNDGGPWNMVDFAEGRIGWSSETADGRLVWRGAPGSVNGGGNSTDGHIRLRESDGGTWSIVDDPGAKNPTISPDGRWVAWEKVESPGNRDIYVYDTHTDGSPFMLAGMSPGDDYLPAFSPDSQSVVFAGTSTDDGKTALHEVPVTSIGVARTVTSDVGDVSGIAWQPGKAPTAGDIAIDATGAPREGDELSYTADVNSGSVPLDDTVTWERCSGDILIVIAPEMASADDGCTDVGTGEHYTAVAEDIGSRLRVRRDVQNPAGKSTTYSDPTEPVEAPADVLAPEAPELTSMPADPTNDPQPSFEWVGKEPGGTFECRVTAGLGDWYPDTGWAPCASPTQTPPLSNGVHVFLVRQIDDAGNEGHYAHHVFDVDLDGPPAPTITSHPDETTTSRAATIGFTGVDEKGGAYECRLDPPADEAAAGWKECESPFVAADLELGAHRFEVRERDQAGNAGAIAWYEWSVKAPKIEEPVIEAPVEEKPVVEDKPVVEEKPVVEDKPVVEENPAVPAPAPVAEAPKTKSVIKPPVLTALIGGTESGPQVGADGPTSSSATIEVAREAVGVGCSITGTVLKSCKVDLFADVPAGAKARAAGGRQVLVGTGSFENAEGSTKMNVKVELNATGKALLRSSPGGLRVSVKITGQPVSGAPLKASGVAKLVTSRVSATVGGFAVDSPVLTVAARRQLRQLAKFGKAVTVRCVGHTDASSDDKRYLRSLGERRAKAVCAFLAAHGVKTTKRVLVTKAATVPVATNTTAAGRAKNRRVQVTLVR